jgi:hypothetical protein
MTTGTEPTLRKRHVPLKRVKNGSRECWVTLLHDMENRVDLVIGAGTKAACIEAFKRISPGTPINPKLVYHAKWRKAKS